MSGRLRVCHLIKGLGRGGAERLLPQLFRARSGQVAYAVGYFLPWKDALVGEVEAAGAPVHCFGTRSNLALLVSIPAVASWLRKERADLVHAHLPLAGVAGRLAGKIAGVPVVYTEHNLQERYHPLTRRANALTWRLQAEVTAVSENVSESVHRHLGTRVPVTVVRNGIEVIRPSRSRREQAAELRHRFNLPEAAPVIGTIAVLRAQKRLDLWLAAARRIFDERPEARFLIVGDGPLRDELKTEAERLGLLKTVRFAGLQEDVYPFLSLFDLYMMSSEFEGLPLALLEALSAGVPVVATAVGGIPEVLGAGGGEQLVPFGRPDLLARAAVALLDDPARRTRLAEAGRGLVEREYGIGRMATELETIYARVSAARHG